MSSFAPPPSSTPTPSGRKPLILGIVAGVAVFLGLVVFAFMSAQASGSAALSRLWAALRSETHLDMSQPTVVQKIQSLQRLETVVYSMDKVVSGGHESSILPDFLAADRLLMLVHGEAVAGIDFSALRPGDVSVTGRRVVIHLPEAQIFSTRLDSARTRVYSRQTGLLVPTDPNLETQVRQEAERQLHDAALSDGILAAAQRNARNTVTSLLQGLGFTEVELR